MADLLREKLKALVEEWREQVTKSDRAFGYRLLAAASIKECADQLAALLAESEGVLSGQAKQRPERAWLIESRFTPAPTWWTGTDHPAPWTRDSLKAVRFCRKCDAEATMAALPDGHFCFASEHQWGFGGD